MTAIFLCAKIVVQEGDMSIKAEKFGSAISTNYFIYKELEGLGLKKTYIAFYYLHDILNLLINQNMVVKSFSREVYPLIAVQYSKKPCTIERDIRNLIKSFWEKQLKIKLGNFWGENCPPTCHKFIYILKNYIIQDLA